MITLRLGSQSQTPTDAPAQGGFLTAEAACQIRLLLNGFGLHAPPSDCSGRALFQNQLKALADSLQGECTNAELASVVAQALRATEDYESKAVNAANRETGDLRRMLQAMTETLAFVSGSQETSIRQLSAIEKRLAIASSRCPANDLKPLLEQALSMLRQECQRLRIETEQKISALNAEVDQLSRCIDVARSAEPADPVTSLPARHAAENALREFARHGKTFAAALYVVDQLPAINRDLGREAGDDVLLYAARTIANGLSEATLYRWSGPALLALFASKTQPSAAERLAKGVSARPIEKSVYGHNGHQLVSSTLSLQHLRISKDLSLDSVFHSFDTFVAMRQASTPSENS